MNVFGCEPVFDPDRSAFDSPAPAHVPGLTWLNWTFSVDPRTTDDPSFAQPEAAQTDGGKVVTNRSGFHVPKNLFP